METGVVYIAYGQTAQAEAAASRATLRQWYAGPVTTLTERTHPAPGGTAGRWAKVNLDLLTPYAHTLYLDADTRIHGPLDWGFHLLDAGADMVIIPSRAQHNDALRHLQPDERTATLAEIPLDPLQLNTGVLWFARDRCAALFAAWRAEWQRWQDKDQGALLRALERAPVCIRVLGYPFNDQHGAVVEHRFGACSK